MTAPHSLNALIMPLSGTKKWYKSKTIFAIITMLVIASNRIFGIEVTEAELQVLIESAAIAAGGAFALYGRFVAKQEVEVFSEKESEE